MPNQRSWGANLATIDPGSCECARVTETLEYLRQTQFLLVVCEENLPDGDWIALLAEMGRLPYTSGLVVASGSADRRQRVEALPKERL